VTLLDAPEPPSRVPSNSLSPDSVARLVSAATVAARLAVELGLEVLLAATPAALAAAAVFSADAALDALRRLDRAEAWPLLMLPIDIVTPIASAGTRAIGRDSQNLRRLDRLPPAGERITQKQVAAGASSVRERAPARIARRERLAHHKTESSVAILTSGDVRR
jgi:hypothetical protein